MFLVVLVLDADHLFVRHTTGGMYLTDQFERDAAIEFLVSMNKRMAWQTGHIVQNLQDQWHALGYVS